MSEIQSRYEDDENKDRILEKVKNSPSLKEVVDVINKYLPGWIVTFMPAYCSEYPHLQEDWEKLCLHMEVPKTQIMIVDEIIFDEKHTVVRSLCEVFTRCGFSVRRKLEYIPCSKCGRAVPTRYIYEKFRHDKSKKVPIEYKEMCGNC